MAANVSGDNSGRSQSSSRKSDSSEGPNAAGSDGGADESSGRIAAVSTEEESFDQGTPTSVYEDYV
jgi:hypothetical protein